MPKHFTCPRFIAFLSDIRININSFINADIPGYTFINLPSPTKAGDVCVIYQKH